MISSIKNSSIKNSIVVKVFASEMIFTVKRSLVKPNMKVLVLALLFLFPAFGFAKPPIKAQKKYKVTKSIKRNILEIEFGTFNYNSPILTKKSIFLS